MTMRFRHHNRLRPLARAASWLLALLCLWMGSGGVLHHTEGLSFGGAASPQTAGGHLTPAGPADDCAACQWTQGVQSGPPLLPHVVLTFSFAVAPPCRVPALVLSRLPLRRSPRAPPALLS